MSARMTANQRATLVAIVKRAKAGKSSRSAHPSDKSRGAVNGVTAYSLKRAGLVDITRDGVITPTDKGRNRADLYRTLDGPR